MFQEELQKKKAFNDISNTKDGIKSTGNENYLCKYKTSLLFLIIVSLDYK